MLADGASLKSGKSYLRGNSGTAWFPSRARRLMCDQSYLPSGTTDSTVAYGEPRARSRETQTDHHPARDGNDLLGFIGAARWHYLFNF